MADETPQQTSPEEESKQPARQEESKKDTVRINLPPGLGGRTGAPSPPTPATTRVKPAPSTGSPEERSQKGNGRDRDARRRSETEEGHVARSGHGRETARSRSAAPSREVETRRTCTNRSPRNGVWCARKTGSSVCHGDRPKRRGRWFGNWSDRSLDCRAGLSGDGGDGIKSLAATGCPAAASKTQRESETFNGKQAYCHHIEQ